MNYDVSGTCYIKNTRKENTSYTTRLYTKVGQKKINHKTRWIRKEKIAKQGELNDASILHIYIPRTTYKR